MSAAPAPPPRRPSPERPVPLAARDVAAVAHASGVLCAPFAYPDVDAWRRAGMQACKAALDADMASALLPCCDAELAASLDLDLGDARRFPDEIRAWDARVQIWRRHVARGAWDRKSLWGADLPAMRASSYYHEYIRPLRLFDAVGLSVSLTDPAREGTIATLWLHHDSERAERASPFGPRGLAMLRLLRPAFAAGVTLVQRLDRHRARFLATLDALGQALALYDRRGRLVHRTPAAAALLDDPRAGPALAAAGTGIAVAIARVGAGAETTASGGPADADALGRAPVARAVATPAGPVRVRGVLAAPDAFREPLALVTFEAAARELAARDHRPRHAPRGPGGPPAAPAFADEGPGHRRAAVHFGLTPREAEVAGCLLTGLTNGRTAARLGVSPHTVRRLGERLYRKVGARSRVELVNRWRSVAGDDA